MIKSSTENERNNGIPGLIVAAQHVEHMPQTWYRDSENRVKKLFPEEYNQYRLFS
jgi:hypothetical protein